jgi:DNA uptake protein ComE-like DNA-binding protein
VKYRVNKSIVFQGAIFTPDKEYELTPEQLAGLRKRGALAGDAGESGIGSTPGHAALDLVEITDAEGQVHHVHQKVADVFSRLLAERDEARAELEALQSAPIMQPGTLTPPLVALESLGSDVVESLVAAGYDTPDAVAAASDKDLEALPGIGEATIKKIRALLK